MQSSVLIKSDQEQQTSPDPYFDLDDLRPKLARKHLLNFVLHTYPEYEPHWFHRLICRKLDALYAGTIKNLMVFMPAQHGKTELTSRRFPAYCLGRNPDLKIAICCYSGDLASNINRHVQRIIDEPAYRELFPETKLSSSKSASKDVQGFVRNASEFEVVGYTGSVKSVGVMGALSGNHVDIAIIDDPIKDAMEGRSSVDRARKWDWYNEVLNLRLHNNSRKLLIMTRWNEDDLAGRILAHETGWEVVSLPYIKEAAPTEDDHRQIGEALWPDRHSVEKAMQIKKNSERAFASLCQQRPAPIEGGLFKRAWFRYFKKTGLPVRFDTIIQSWDCTFNDAATSDYVVGQVWGKKGAEAYLIDMVRGQWSFTDTMKQIRLLTEKYPLSSRKLIEDKANGSAIIDTLKKEISGIIPISPTESKESRASAVSFVVEAGNIFLPEEASWLPDFIEELCVFPNGRHDDMVDALSQALNHLFRGHATPGLFVL